MQTENNAKTTSKRRDRQFYTGGWAVLAAVIVLAVLVLLNVAVGKLPESWTNYDLTAVKLYSIGDQTRAIVKGLEEPVTVYWLVSEGNEDVTVRELLERYDELSDKLTVEKVDLTTRPTFAAAYTEGNVYQNSLIVESEKRFKVVNYTSIYVTDYIFSEDYSDYTTSTTFEGENALTGALDYVTTDTLPVVYYLSGHGEPGLDSGLKEQIAALNFTLQDLTLMGTDGVPADAAAVIVDSPAGDLYDGEAQQLLDYAAAGGKLVLLTNYGQADMPNLKQVTDAFGVYLQEGVVVEGDPSRYYQYPIYLLPQVESHTITGTLASGNMYILYYLGQGIAKAEDIAAELTVQPLLTSTELAYAKVDAVNSDTLEKEEGDVDGPFDMAVLVSNENTQGQLVWYTTGALLDSGVDQMVAGNNTTLFINTLGFLCEHENAISIEGKNIAGDTLMVSTAAAGWWRTLYAVLLPLGCIAAGAVIFIRRRALR